MENVSEIVSNVNKLILNVKVLIDGMHERPLMYVSEFRLDYIYHFIIGYLGGTVVNGKEEFSNIPFTRLLFDWILEWIRKNLDKNYVPRGLCWHHIIYDVTNSESEAVELFFKICSEILHEVSEEELKRCRITI